MQKKCPGPLFKGSQMENCGCTMVLKMLRIVKMELHEDAEKYTTFLW